MKTLRKDKKPWDGVVLSHLSEDITTDICNELTEECQSVTMLNSYLQLVMEDYAKNQIATEMQEAIIDYDRIKRLIEAPAKVVDEVSEIDQRSLWLDAIECSKNATNEDIDMPLPFADVNIMTNGIPKQSLVFIGGSSSNGKSMCLMNIIHHLLNHGKKCLLVDYEMKLENIIHRITAIATGIPLNHFIQGRTIHGQILTSQQEDTVESELNYYMEKYEPLLIIQENLREDGIRSAILKHKPDFVSVDHIQLYAQLMPRNKNDTMALHVSGLCANLKDMAKSHNVTICCPSQVGRSAKNGLPTMTDLKESGGIEENSDIVFTVFIPYNSSQNPQDRGKFKFQIAKNRNGGVGFVDLDIVHETGQIRDKKYEKVQL